jgi:hypothetical protein
MKTFFTIVENHAKKDLGVLIFTDNNLGFQRKREEFVFSNKRNRIDLECIDEDLPRERIEPENETIKVQLFFMLSNIKHNLKEKGTICNKAYITKNVSKKFKHYNQVIQNIFLQTGTKENIKEIFSKSQRTYHAFLRFAQRIRIKHAKMNITSDLSLTPIEPNQKNTIIIYQNKTKYPFTLSDLINIILTAVTNAPLLFPSPFIPKNPYNNIPFSKSIMYHIYWSIKSSNILMPPLINSYFWSSFNLNDFIVNNEQAIRDYTIKKYVLNSPVTVIYDEIIQMLDNSSNMLRGLDIDPDFPRTQLVEIMKPYLFLYIMKNDGILGTEKRRVSKILYKRKLMYFINYNPYFGRKTIKCKKPSSDVASIFSRSCLTNDYVPPLVPLSIPLSGNSIALQAVVEMESRLVSLWAEPIRDDIVVSGTNELSDNVNSNEGVVTVPKKEQKIFVFNTENPGLTIKKIEKLFKNYNTITSTVFEYDSESDNDSDTSSSVSVASLPLERNTGTRIHMNRG